MNGELGEGELALAMSGDGTTTAIVGISDSTCLHHVESQGAGSVVLLRNPLQSIDHLRVTAFTDEKLGRFAETDDGDSGNTHYENECAVREPDVAPAGVRVPITRLTSLRFWA